MAEMDDHDSPRQVRLDQAQMLALLRQDGATALSRRPDAFFAGLAMTSGELAVLSLGSLLGLWLFDASPLTMFWLVYAGLCGGIVVQWVKYLALREAVRRESARGNADRLLWAVVDRVRSGHPGDCEHRDVAPESGLIVDLLFGGVSALVLLVAMIASGNAPWHALQADSWLGWLIALLVATQAGAAWRTVRRQRQGRDGALQFAAGGRGLGLFLLMFAVMIGGPARLALVLTVVNLLQLAWGVVSLYTIGVMRAEARWLREHLASLAHP
jgi:hypothetical protein